MSDTTLHGQANIESSTALRCREARTALRESGVDLSRMTVWEVFDVAYGFGYDQGWTDGFTRGELSYLAESFEDLTR